MSYIFSLYLCSARNGCADWYSQPARHDVDR